MRNTNSFIKYLGIGFVFVGLLKISGFVKIEFKYIFSLSLAGFWFVLFDFVSSFLDQVSKKPFQSALKYLRNGTLLLAALTIIAVPFTPIKWNTPFLKVITDSLVYLSLGIVIYLIGVKDESRLKTSSLDERNDELNSRLENL